MTLKLDDVIVLPTIKGGKDVKEISKYSENCSLLSRLWSVSLSTEFNTEWKIWNMGVIFNKWKSNVFYWRWHFDPRLIQIFCINDDVYLPCSESKILFLGKFRPKSQNYLFKYNRSEYVYFLLQMLDDLTLEPNRVVLEMLRCQS